MSTISTSRRAAAASGCTDTTWAAAELLRAGGNAFDAAVAAGFASAVAEPTLTSLGGGGFLLAAAPGQQPAVFDFFVDAPGHGHTDAELVPHFIPATVRYPGADQVFNVGWGSVGVPGCLDGLLHVHRRLGRLPLADVVAPAISLAQSGVEVTPMQGGFAALLPDILLLTQEGRDLFAPKGELIQVGDRMHNYPLADVLTDIAEERITGIAHWGRELEQAMSAGGGLMTAADAAAYRVVERAPLEVNYRGSQVLTNPPPSFGGTLVTGGLGTLATDAPLDGSVAAYRRLTEVLVTMSERKPTEPQAVRGTTHVSVVDGDGAVAIMTTSSGSCGGVYIPGTGIQLNNVMGEEDLHPQGFHATPPGMRIGSMMSPTVVRLPGGEVVGLGTGGSERIRSAITRVLVGVLDEGMSLSEAVHSPRLHWDRADLQVEPGLPAEVLDALRADRSVNEWAESSMFFGGVHAVRRSSEGVVTAIGDRRRGGVGEVVDQP